MGLDMYLSRKFYVSEYHPEYKQQFGLTSQNLVISGEGFESVTPSCVEYIIERAGYWRKANQIHNWFVKNCGEGVDDCRPYYVSREHMQELLDTINKVLENTKLVDGQIHTGSSWTKETGNVENYEDGKVVANPEFAAEFLPTEAGFFFGGTDYDQYYIEDLESTKKILEENLQDKYAGWEFEYRASW